MLVTTLLPLSVVHAGGLISCPTGCSVLRDLLANTSLWSRRTQCPRLLGRTVRVRTRYVQDARRESNYPFSLILLMPLVVLNRVFARFSLAEVITFNLPSWLCLFPLGYERAAAHTATPVPAPFSLMFRE
jgi:hypothetical protein